MKFHSLVLLHLVNAASNTNYCVIQSIAAKDCFHQSTPSSACCTVIKAFRDNKCFCNKLGSAILGSSDLGPPSTAEIGNALAKCGSSAPVCTGFGTKSYNSGTCHAIDEDLDFYRFAAAKSFADMLLTFSTQFTCFDYDGFRTALNNLFNTNAVAYAGQGLGTYSGIDAIAEYFSLLAPKVNKGFLQVSPAASPLAAIYVSANGQDVSVGLNVVNKFANGTFLKNAQDYLETTFSFSGCDTKASKAIVPGQSNIFPDKRVTGVAALADMLYKTVNLDTKYPNDPTMAASGITSICKQHMMFCKGSNSQFLSEADCISFYKTLPRYSAKCGTAALLSGNSVTCRAKHQFMAQNMPAAHCKHLGRVSEACDDTKCENPGLATAVDPNNWPSNLLTALSSYATKLNAQYPDQWNGWWSRYCSAGNFAIGSVIQDFAVSDTQVWGVGPTGTVYKWDGATFYTMPGTLKQIAVCPNGKVYGISSANTFYIYTGTTWSVLSGSLSTIACGNDGYNENALYGVNSGGQVYYMQSGSWVPISGTISPKIGSLAVGYGKAWGINSAGVAFSRSYNTDWAPVPGNCTSIAAGVGGVFGLDSLGNIYQLDAATKKWNRRRGILKSIAVNNQFLYGSSDGGIDYSRTISSMSP